MDRGLRDRSKRAAAERSEREQRRQHKRYDMESKGARRRTGARDAGERLIRRRHKPLSESDSLRLVRIEDPIVRAMMQNRRKLPREIHGIADTRVHALAAHGTMNVRSV